MPIDLIHSEASKQSCDQPWYAIYTRHQHEKSVAQCLTGKGFEVFLPLYAALRRRKDRTKLLALPLFPCYVFVNGGLDRRLDMVTTPGLHALVSNCGQPAAIPNSEIDALRRAMDSGAQVEPHPLLKCGDWVRVKHGSLRQIEGILVRKKNVYRLVLSVKILGKAVAVEVDAVTVERIDGNRLAVCHA